MSNKIVKDIIHKATVCRIGMFDDKYPQIIPMNFGYEKNRIYLHSSINGHKLKLISKIQIYVLKWL